MFGRNTNEISLIQLQLTSVDFIKPIFQEMINL